MNITTVSFNSKTNFNYATALVDLYSLECVIDNSNSTILTPNKESFITAFDLGGIDPEEFAMAEGSKQTYLDLQAKAAEALAAAIAAEEDSLGDE